MRRSIECYLCHVWRAASTQPRANQRCPIRGRPDTKQYKWLNPIPQPTTRARRQISNVASVNPRLLKDIPLVDWTSEGLLQASDTVNTQNDRNPYDECAVVSTRDDKSIRGPFQAPHSPISGRGSSIRDVEIEPKHGGDIEGGSDDGSRNHDGFANDDNVRSGSIRIHGLPTGVMTEEEFTDVQAAAKSRAVQLILSDWVEPSVYGHVSQSV